MKICLINNLYKPYARGGAERIVELTAEGLSAAGNEVFIIATKPHFSALSLNNLPKTYYITSCYYNLSKIPAFIRLFWHGVDMFDFITAWKIKKILQNEKPDLVITNNLKGLSYLLPRSIKKLNIRHFHLLHDIQLLHPSGLLYFRHEPGLDNFFAKLYARINVWLFFTPNIVISPSRWLLDLHVGRNFFAKSRQLILPNPALLAINNLPVQSKHDKFTFIYVGQIEEHKGVILLVKAFLRLVNKYENCCLKIVGNGSKLEIIKKLAAGVDEVGILGQKEKTEIQNLMASADCLIVPSICYENSPSVIYEAASAGLPVIAADIGGIPELVEKIGGWPFAPANENDLVAKMGQAINNRAELEKIGAQSRERVKQFSLENYVERIISLVGEN